MHSWSHDADYTIISLQTALHLAAHTKQHDMLRKLLVSDASLHLTDHKGNTPLHIICRFNSTKCLEEILKFVKLNTILEVSQIRNNEGQTCIHIAAQQGNTNALRKLRCIGVDINMQVCQKCGSVCRHVYYGFYRLFTFRIHVNTWGYYSNKLYILFASPKRRKICSDLQKLILEIASWPSCFPYSL